jgi:hypothetical protein
LLASRWVLVSVEEGNKEYSAVTQPEPVPFRKRGTFCSIIAEHNTIVSPVCINTEPSGFLVNPGVMRTGRISSLSLLFGLVILKSSLHFRYY